MAGKHVLMVEGRDDEYVVKHICGQRQLGEIETIRKYDGKDELLQSISVRVKESDIGVLGIILDADTNLQTRWQSVADRLRAAGYLSIPATPDQSGTVIAPPANTTLPKVGIWLMPNNNLPGILEDFLLFLVPHHDDLRVHAETSVASIPGQRRFSDLNKTKALIHTWLAWQEEPGKPFGQAISARYLDPNLPAGNIFADWLQRTFFS